MEAILVQLPDETGKVGVFEYPRENGFSKFGHILDDEGVTLGTPGYDVDDLGLLEHPVFCQPKRTLRRGSNAHL